MKKRYYIYCPVCHKRMRVFTKNIDQEHRFYLCACGQRVTYFAALNAVSEGWPDEVFDEAVRQRVIDSTGRIR